MAGTPPLPEGCEVVAEGLINPRYVAIADDGTLYVTEAGTGGNDVLPPAVAEEAAEVVGTPAGGGRGGARGGRGSAGDAG